MKQLCLSVILILLSSAFFGQQLFNPTGTYEYKGKTSKIDGTVYGPYVGTIQVKEISNTEIVISLFICKGAPSYNIGSFIDTLHYKNNFAVYKNSESHTSCKITFQFDKKGVLVKEEAGDGCDFGNGVIANGYFRKKSSKQPGIMDPITEVEVN